MEKYLPVFRDQKGEKLALKAYDVIMGSWPVPYEDLYLNTRAGLTHIIACGPSGAPPVFLIHAFYASAASWYKTVGALCENYRVFAVDIIGDPNKSKPFKPIRKVSDYEDWFLDVMDGLLLHQADFIGNSVGAFHVMNFALHAPQRVRRMILIGPAATFLKNTPFYLNTFPGGITGWTFLVKHAVRWVENGSPLEPGFHRLFHLMLKHGKSANQVFPRVFDDNELEKIITPALLIYGDREVIYDFHKAIQRAEKYLRNVRAEMIPGANHLTAVSNPEMTNKIMLDFLRKT